ncbi:MAG: DUF2207 domain-containing protein [Propionibacteriaceae bacterium]|nr:DUF2207 domain-containing protein [Propionibacteriaceae bacterium]
MLRTWSRWIAYPIVMVVVLVAASIPHTMSRSSQASDPANQFQITHFAADYVLTPQPDGTTDVLVTERIEADFPTSRTNRGILRAIPLRYQDHTNSLTEVAVTGDLRTTTTARYGRTDEAGGPVEFTRIEENDVVLLRIGDPDAYLSAGRQVYEITYRLGDIALNTPDGSAQEIYLDATGSGWEVPFTKVTARLHVPATLAGRLNGNTACYQGPEGSTDRCGGIATTPVGDGVLVTATGERLARRAGLTFAVGFEPGTFPVAYTPVREAWPWWLFVLPAIGLLFYLVSLANWLRVRGFGRPRVLVTEYLPPKGVPAIAAAHIMGRPERGPTAQLIELVESGVLHLRTSQPPEPRPDGPPKPLSFLARRRLRRSLMVPTDELDAIADEDLRTIMRGYFGYDFGETPHPEVGADLAQQQQELVVRGGWREWGRAQPGWFGFMVFVFLVAGGIGMYAVHPRGQDFWWALLSGVIGMLLLIAALHRHPGFGPLTEEGRRVRAHLLGLKHFIGLAEANRIAWLQGADSAPVVSADDHAALVKLYEPLLPFAIIFGQEKSWTAVLGEHQRVVPGAGQWLGQLQAVPLGDVVRSVDQSYRHRDSRSLGGFRSLGATNQTIGDGFRSVGGAISDALDTMADSRNDGGGSRWGGGSSGGRSWSSGGSRGGGRSGGGMGGGGGGGW